MTDLRELARQSGRFADGRLAGAEGLRGTQLRFFERNRLHRALAATTALVAVASVVLPTTGVRAQSAAPGNGGNGGDTPQAAGGRGGMPGADGGDRRINGNFSGGGGGGGGAGIAGAARGGIGGAGSNGVGGIGGLNGGNGNSRNGGDAVAGSAGGGGGGGYGTTGTFVSVLPAEAIVGGNGGAGAAANPANGSAAGGGGGGGGGTAVSITPGGTQNSSNQGSITGGQGGLGGNGTGTVNANAGGGGGGGIGFLFNGDGGLDNTGSISGGRGGNAGQPRDLAIGNVGGAGGTAVSFGSVGQVNNSGNITGGDGGIGSQAFVGGRGGDGVSFAGSGSRLNNSGQGRIVGGSAGFSSARGGAGASFAGSGFVSNSDSGSISGGQGSPGVRGGVADGSGTRGGDGGGGVMFLGAGASNIVNSGQGVISGGQGGDGGQGVSGGGGGNGGSGGIGLSFVGSGSLDNSGTIRGGNGGAGGAGNAPGPAGTPGAGGVGVTGANLTIVNSGTISGGLPGDRNPANRANAITFTGGTNSLELRSGYSFVGRVVDQTGRATLILGGATTAADTTLDAGTIGAGQQYDGFSALQKTGTSTWTLVGTNATKLAYRIDGGTLEVDGTIAASTITVNNGGTLAGIGTIGDPQINAGGTLSPGNTASPYGTLTIGGPLTFAPGSFYNVNVNPTQNSRTNVIGTTTIQGGTVNVVAGQGTYATRQYTILNATQGVTGTFAGVTTSAAFAFLAPSLAYDANNVFLNIAPASPVTSVNGRQVPDYRTAAATQNQFNVASGLTEAGRRSNGRGPVLNALNQLTVPQAQRAFDSLSGEGITAAQNVAFRSAELFTSSIFDQTTFYAGGGAANSVTLTERLPGLPAFFASTQPVRELADLPAARVEPVAIAPVANRTWRAWANGYGGIENISGNRAIGSAAQRNDIFGGALGVDYQLLPNYLIGVAVGGSNGNFRVDQRGTSGSTTGGHIALYDLFELGNWYGASSSSFSYFGNQTTRFVNGFGGLGTEQNRGNFNSNEFRTRLEVGRHFASLPALGGLPTFAGFGTVTPFVALEIASLRSNGFTETPLKGGPGLFRLNVSGQTAASTPGFVGLRFQKVAPLGNGMVLSPTLQVAYVHEFAPYRNQVGTLASLPGSTFLVDGARPARDAAQVKAGAELALGPHSAVFANFDGEFSGINQLYAGKGGFRYTW